MSKRNSYKVLIAEDEATSARFLADFLKERGFETDMEFTSGALFKKLSDWKPHFCICNMMLKEGTGIQILDFVREQNLETKVFISSSHNNIENVKAALKAGAKDYIVKPYQPEDILSRLVFHIQKKRAIPGAGEKPSGKEEQLLVQLMQFVLKEANSQKKIRQILFNHTKMLEITLKAVRCSLIRCEEDRQTGFVVSSSDDRTLFGLQIDLNRYPEVIHVMNTEKMVVIENIEGDPTLAMIKENVKSIAFNAIIVAPIWRRGQFYGVISARMPKEKGGFSDNDIRFTQLLSSVMSLVVSMDLEEELHLEKKAA